MARMLPRPLGRRPPGHPGATDDRQPTAATKARSCYRASSATVGTRSCAGARPTWQ